MLPRYDAHVIGRDDAIRLLEEQHADVSGLLEELADDAFVRRGTIGGGEWSAKDLALHLGSWELFALETLEQLGRGERPSVEDALGHDGATDRLNEEQVNLQLDVEPGAARARFEERHRRIVGAIAAMDEAAWATGVPLRPRRSHRGRPDRVVARFGGRPLHPRGRASGGSPRLRRLDQSLKAGEPAAHEPP